MKAIEKILEVRDEVVFDFNNNHVSMAVIPSSGEGLRVESDDSATCVLQALRKMDADIAECEDMEFIKDSGISRIVIEKYKGSQSNEEILGYMKRCGWKDFFRVYDKMRDGSIYEALFLFGTKYGNASSSAYSYSVENLLSMIKEMIKDSDHLPDEMCIRDAVESCTDCYWGSPD